MRNGQVGSACLLVELSTVLVQTCRVGGIRGSCCSKDSRWLAANASWGVRELPRRTGSSRARQDLAVAGEPASAGAGSSMSCRRSPGRVATSSCPGERPSSRARDPSGWTTGSCRWTATTSPRWEPAWRASWQPRSPPSDPRVRTRTSPCARRALSARRRLRRAGTHPPCGSSPRRRAARCGCGPAGRFGHRDAPLLGVRPRPGEACPPGGSRKDGRRRCSSATSAQWSTVSG